MDATSLGIGLGIVGILITIVIGYIPPQVQRKALVKLKRAARRALPRRIFGPRYYTVGAFAYEPMIRRNLDRDNPDAPPYEGPWIRLMEDVGKILDIEFRFCPISASDFKHIASVSSDFVIGLFQTPPRRLSFDFSAPVHRIRLQGICRRDRAKITKEELSSGELKIGVQSGEVGWEYVDDQLAHLRDREGAIQEFGTDATFKILNHVLGGVVDVAICDELSCIRFLADRDHRRKYQLAFDWPMVSYSACIAVKKSLFWNMKRLSEAMKTARNDPSFLAYEASWIVGDYQAAIEKCYISYQTPLGLDEPASREA